ncbi:MAG: ISAzo13 family transposase, partial [Planctomycetota bacterium]
MDEASAMRERYEAVHAVLNERTRRLWAGAEALAIGRGGIAAVQRVTGLAYETIARGMREAHSPPDLVAHRIRGPGAGRKRVEIRDPDLAPTLESLVEPGTRGDPMSSLRWTIKSTRVLARGLTAQGHPVGRTLVGEFLHALGYSLQSTRKTREGSKHVDRNAQFEYINDQATAFLKGKRPVISVDTKKKEKVGD